MKKKKILYFITDLQVGGAERMLEKLVNSIDKKKFDVSVCSMIKGGKIASNLKNKGISVYTLNVKTPFEFFKAIKKLRRLITTKKPDILHCFMYHANIVGRLAAKGTNCKIISSVRGKLVNAFQRLVDGFTQHLVDVHTVNSLNLKRFVKGYGIKENKIKLIYNGVNLRKLKPTKKASTIKRALNLKNIPTLISVANLRKEKDYPTLIKSVKIAQKETDLNFLVVGGGTDYEDETKKIKSLVKRLNVKNVRFLGYRGDIPNLLSISDIWISATLTEGQSNSLIEAMAMKKAIITTDIPENAEVARNGKEASLVPVSSPKKTANSIIRLIKNKKLASKLGNNAYKRVKEYFDIKHTVSKTEKLYVDICRK